MAREDANPRGLADPDLGDHPAARAWSAVDPGCRVTGIEVLKEGPKTAAYRLRFGDGVSVIAKRQRRDIVERERATYAFVLPHLGDSLPKRFGSADLGEPEHAWTFLADLGELRYSPTSRTDRNLAAEWLARLHSIPAPADVGTPAEIPRVTPADYDDRLRAVRTRIQVWLDEEHETSTRELLGAALDSLDRARASWEALEREWERQPQALVHGDFAEKNRRVGVGDGRKVLFVFDWDMAAIVVPAVDLSWVEHDDEAVAVYARHVTIPALRGNAPAVRRAARLGSVLRTIDRMQWKAWRPTISRSVCDRALELAEATGRLGLE